MGVTGLWKLIEPCGQPVPVETLECKILAVDISIWLHQVVKGFQDSKGGALPNAHLLGLFNRLCKLLYYRVKPVFVFDGCVPQLKRETIARRQMQRSKLNTEADRITALLLQSLAKEKVVQQALGANVQELLQKSPSKQLSKAARKEEEDDDMFKLPELPAIKEKSEELEDLNSSTSNTDDSWDEHSARHYYNANLQAIDVRSEHFKSLPADVRYEILLDIKETRKQSSWGRLHELPSKSEDFSSFQMKRLLKRRAVQESLDTAAQEMGGKTLTFSELTDFFSEEGIIETDKLDKGTRQISSDEHTRYLLVRDLKKKTEAQEEDTKTGLKDIKVKEEAKDTDLDVKPSTSNALREIKMEEVKTETKTEDLGADYEADLELAIALSLEDANIYNEKDYEYASDEAIKLNRNQRENLRDAAKGPARAYLLEYAGFNEDEVEGIMEKTQVGEENQDYEDFSFCNEEETKSKNITNTIEKETALPAVTAPTNGKEKDNEKEKTVSETIMEISDSDDDDDFIEVPELEVPKSDKAMEIVVDLSEPLNKDDDLFADVFEAVPKTHVFIPETPPDFDENVKNVDASKSYKAKDDFLEDVNERDRETVENINEKLSEEVKKAATSAMPKIREDLADNQPLEVQKPTQPNSDTLKMILENLKQQAAAVHQIKLDDIKIDAEVAPLIVLSSDDEKSEAKNVKTATPAVTPTKSAMAASNDFIEIPDDEDIQSKPAAISPNMKTPSKNKTITEFFETQYIIKRTLDKPAANEETEAVSKVKSPFFVKKTPKSKRKSGEGSSPNSNSNSPEKKMSKAARELFDAAPEPVEIKEEVKKLDPLTEAANVLKDQKTTEELKELADDLARQQRELENERNRQDRMGMTITQRMSSECQELLRLFGIPYIVAPMEAEAQCAFLDAVGLTNGTITDDSDIWLFGGRTVYKNFFAQNKHVLEFRSQEIEKNFNCDRMKLIQLACLVGSDYTTGIHGIGAVTALEILAMFSTRAEQNALVAEQVSAHMILTTLSRFRDWWQTAKNAASPVGSSSRLALLKKLKNIEIQEGFPSVAVIDAYLSPKVDDNKDTFSWGHPDVESIFEYTRKNFGWTRNKTNDILTPVLKRIEEKKSQKTITNYFNIDGATSSRQLKVSKRVQSAIEKMSTDATDEQEESAAAEKPKRGRKTKRKNAATEQSQAEIVEESRNVVTEPAPDQVANGPSKTRRVPAKQPARVIATNKAKLARIPEANPVIPQRVKDAEQLLKNKEIAIAKFKQTNQKGKGKK